MTKDDLATKFNLQHLRGFTGLEALLDQHVKLDAAIRKHHAAVGHDMCHENDVELHAALGLESPRLTISECEFLAKCKEYWEGKHVQAV